MGTPSKKRKKKLKQKSCQKKIQKGKEKEKEQEEEDKEEQKVEEKTQQKRDKWLCSVINSLQGFLQSKFDIFVPETINERVKHGHHIGTKH